MIADKIDFSAVIRSYIAQNYPHKNLVVLSKVDIKDQIASFGRQDIFYLTVLAAITDGALRNTAFEIGTGAVLCQWGAVEPDGQSLTKQFKMLIYDDTNSGVFLNGRLMFYKAKLGNGIIYREFGACDLEINCSVITEKTLPLL